MLNTTAPIPQDNTIDLVSLFTLIGVGFTSLVALVQVILKTPCQSSCFRGCFWYDGTANREENHVDLTPPSPIILITPENSTHVNNHSHDGAHVKTTAPNSPRSRQAGSDGSGSQEN